MGGGNVIRASRTLNIRDLNAHLEEYPQDPLEAIEHQINTALIIPGVGAQCLHNYSLRGRFNIMI